MTTIKRRIATVTAIPLCGLLVFGGMEISQTFDRFQDARRTEAFSRLAVSAGAAVHELQKERGLSAMFLSGGADAAGRLEPQRTATDAAVADFRRLAASAHDGSAAVKPLQGFLSGLQDLSAFRAQVSGRRVAGPASLKFYSDLIGAGLRFDEVMARSAGDADIARSLLVYVDLANGKEYAGKERAIGASNLAGDRFSAEAWQAWLPLEGRQQALLSAVERYGSPTQNALWEQMRASPEEAAVLRLRQQVRAYQAGEAGAAKLAAPEWFAATTARIDRLHALEKAYAAEAQRAAGAARAEALQALVLQGVLALAILAAALGAAIALVASITRPLARLTGDLQRLAAGDADLAIDALHRKDELGQIARAIGAVRDATVARMEQEFAATAQRDRARQAEAEQRRAAEDALAAEQQRVVGTLAAELDRLARRDLRARVDERFSGAFEKLRTDFNQAAGALRDTIGSVALATEAIAQGAAEIASASDDLSRRTEHQAASLEETAAALDQIGVTVRRTAGNAAEAARSVAVAHSEAERSRQVLDETVAAMSAIEQSSGRIGQIVGVMDEIAFQTNLLALNAGVEAARAGDAGRGFAVVASEVRALAQRSAVAAKEIKGLISQSTEQVDRGVRLVGHTGEALTAILGRIHAVQGLVRDMAASAEEEASGIAQVNMAVGTLDQVTQQNAAMVEEATAAAASLRNEAGRLAALVGAFDVGQAGAPDGRRLAA